MMESIEQSNNSDALLQRLSLSTLAKVDQINGSNIYQLPSGSWQTQEMAANESIGVANNSLEFEKQLGDDSVLAVIVPQDALLTDELVKQILERQSKHKTILWEVK